jgi:hypothetical protein
MHMKGKRVIGSYLTIRNTVRCEAEDSESSRHHRLVVSEPLELHYVLSWHIWVTDRLNGSCGETDSTPIGDSPDLAPTPTSCLSFDVISTRASKCRTSQKLDGEPKAKCRIAVSNLVRFGGNIRLRRRQYRSSFRSTSLSVCLGPSWNGSAAVYSVQVVYSS